jgi:hypothetical protein
MSLHKAFYSLWAQHTARNIIYVSPSKAMLFLSVMNMSSRDPDHPEIR